MFGGFRSQVVFPVAIVALLLVSLAATGFSFWATQHEEARVRQQVADNVTAIQEVFFTTAALMEDRTRSSMALLQDLINARGGAERGPPVTVGDQTVRDIVVGGKGQAGYFDIVDYVTRMNKGTATIFSRDGERFVRVTTNIMLGTELSCLCSGRY